MFLKITNLYLKISMMQISIIQVILLINYRWQENLKRAMPQVAYHINNSFYIKYQSLHD